MSEHQEERVEVSDALFIQAIQHLRVGGPRNIALAQSLEEDAIRSATPQDPDGEPEWPVVEVAISLNGKTPGLPKAYVNERAPYSYRSTPDIWAVQEYVPASAPNVLSEEEARIISVSATVLPPGLRTRLATYAKGADSVH